LDKLTEMVEDYKETKDQSLILKMQNIIYPIVRKLIYKWRFNYFPLIIQEHLYEEAKTIILAEAIQKFDASKRAKFTSFYGTRLNHLLRAEYMKYFQKGKPIAKRWGRLHEISINLEYGQNQTLADILQSDSDIRTEIQNDFLKEAIKKLKPKERKIVQLLYFNKVSQNKIKEQTGLTTTKLKQTEESILTKLKLTV